MTYRYFIALLVCSLLSCGNNHPLKPGHQAVSMDGIDDVPLFKETMKTKNIPFYTYMEEGKEFVAFPREQALEVDEVRKQVNGLAPANFEGLCFEAEVRASQQSSLLASHAVEHIVREMPRTHEYCVYWPTREDARVQEVDATYRAILAAKAEYEKSRKQP